MKASSLLLVCFLLGCGQPKSENLGQARPSPKASAKTDVSKVLGEWKVVGDTSGRGDTGTLKLDSSGTFDMSYTIGGKAGTTDKMSGTFVADTQSIEGVDMLRIELRNSKLKGSGNPNGMIAQLIFDPNRNILHDFLTVVYARPGEEAKVQKELERERAESSQRK